jgi:NitT/TauT family transport system substrate-binding protein
MEAGGKVLVEEKNAVTTVLVARARFLGEKRDLVRQYLAMHRALTEWIVQHPAEAQQMVRDDLKATFKIDLPADLLAHAWPRMTVTSDVALETFQSFVASAQKVGFLRSIPDLARLIETP